MSMTYYAVTDDPNELAHFGIKGMKWGVRRTDAQLGHPRHTGSRKPRSAAYKKAQGKLGISMKNGIKRVEARWNEYNSPRNKAIRAAKRYERQTDRAIEKARKGKLKYKKLTDDQVMRVTERLAMERQAKQLSDTETRFRTRLAKSIGAGVIAGVGSGIGQVVGEKISRGSKLKTDRMRQRQANKIELEKEEKRFKRESSEKYQRQQAKNEFNKEYFRKMAEEGDLHSRTGRAVRNLAKLADADLAAAHIGNVTGDKNLAREARQQAWNEFKQDSRRGITQTGRAEYMREKRLQDMADERTKRQQEARDRAYYTNAGKLAAEREYGSSSSSTKPTAMTKSEKPKPVSSVKRKTSMVSRHSWDDIHPRGASFHYSDDSSGIDYVSYRVTRERRRKKGG